MLDGNRYFGCFPDEKRSRDGLRSHRPNRLTPGLLAALEQLDRELRRFLKQDEPSER
jgi:hypothetical protein